METKTPFADQSYGLGCPYEFKGLTIEETVAYCTVSKTGHDHAVRRGVHIAGILLVHVDENIISSARPGRCQTVA